MISCDQKIPHEKINGHGELTVSSQWPRWPRLRGPMITAQSWLGEVTAQSRRGHSEVTAQSRRGHSSITASSVWSRLSHGRVTALSRPRSRLSHGWLWPFWSPWAHGELTMSSWWAHGELTVSSHGGHFFFSWDVFEIVNNQRNFRIPGTGVQHFTCWWTSHVLALQWRHNESRMASQIPGFSIVCCTFYSGAEQRKHQSSALLPFVRGIRWPVDSPHKGTVSPKIFPFIDVIMGHL